MQNTRSHISSAEGSAKRVKEPILVTGGTGTLGTLVVNRLRQRGSGVRVLSRNGGAAQNGLEFARGDLVTGEGTLAAVDGAEVVIHCAGTNAGHDLKTRHLVDAASHAGVR